jgi:hypothetical protein
MNQLGIASDLFLPFLMGGSLPNRKEMLEIIRATIRSELERIFRNPEEPDPVQG